MFPVEHNRRRSNCSIHIDRTKTIIAARDGICPGRIILADLDLKTMLATKERPLNLPIELTDEDGVVDPRLFTFDRCLYCAYTYEVASHSKSYQCLAKITSDGVVLTNTIFDRLHEPYEKNWQFFEHNDELLIAYSFSPDYIILGLDLKERYRTKGIVWDYGTPHGSTPPIRVGKDLVSLFHSYVGTEWHDHQYFVGYFVTQGKPPFKIINHSTQPIMRANSAHFPPTKHCRSVFPCGLLKSHDQWFISYGYCDYWSFVLRTTWLERTSLESVEQGRRVIWADSPDLNDLGGKCE